ncbi:MAG: DUF2892 domain-containing protein [Desulfohalobiaceae bacterium]|nr:DUF2892 domain-containing protein [Desulfohalobiaceae bacterium]
MDMNRILRGIAGGMVLLSLLLAVVFSWWWLLLTLFVGANLLQSAFSGTCPMMKVLRMMGFRAVGDEDTART